MSLTLWLIVALVAAACSPASTPPTPDTLSGTALPIIATPDQAEPSATPAGSPAPAEAANPQAGGELRLVLAEEGNEARYRVREQLANVSLPNDAVGATRDITGVLVVNADGSVARDQSRFVVDLTTLTSDKSRRDNFIKSNTLQTNQYPTAEFAPAEAAGLPTPLPTSGTVTFQLLGDLTVHGVTRPTTWTVTAEIVGGQALVGNATTSFTFADFGMTAPRVPIVLSVEDTIRLELDFHLVRENG